MERRMRGCADCGGGSSTRTCGLEAGQFRVGVGVGALKLLDVLLDDAHPLFQRRHDCPENEAVVAVVAMVVVGKWRR